MKQIFSYFHIFQAKYIGALLKTAQARKREQERRVERQVQKEREEEGGEFADKEEFVTGAYKKKLIEMQEEEEAERRKEQLEGERKCFCILLTATVISLKR